MRASSSSGQTLPPIWLMSSRFSYLRSELKEEKSIISWPSELSSPLLRSALKANGLVMASLRSWLPDTGHGQRQLERVTGKKREEGREKVTRGESKGFVLFVGCLTSQQQASVSQGRICSDKLTCCHTETEVADQTFYLTQSQYTDTGPTSPSADPISPGA